MSEKSPSVWVLSLGRDSGNVIPTESAEVQTSEEVTGFAQVAASAFDQLDLESTCFEQFLIQDARNTAKSLEIFGGPAAFVQLQAAMNVASLSASLVRLTTFDSDAEDRADGTAVDGSLDSSGIRWDRIIAHDIRSDLNTPEIERALTANLVWLEAQALMGPDSKTANEQILTTVITCLEHHATSMKNWPVLIVVFRCGENIRTQRPFACGVEEKSIHVPFWIRSGQSHLCRIQALVGSFDLLPTIATFLGCMPENNIGSENDALLNQSREQQSENAVEAISQELSSEPRSLAFLCGAPQVCSDRLLVLRGDGWKAARTEKFLLVMTDDLEITLSEPGSDGDSSEEPSRRLYIKPEDRYNVNDVSGTYVAVAESLTRLAWRH